MAYEYQAEQGTIVPTLFIGMGGVGSRIADRIAGRAKRLPNWDTQLGSLSAFMSVDTNEGDQHQLKHIPQGNRIHIGAFNKAKVINAYRRSEEKQAWHWLDKGYKPRSGVKPGAGQIRIEARLGFFFASKKIRQDLKRAIESLLSPGNTWRQNHPKKIKVYIFNTLAGGTGSGSFLLMAYLVQAVIKEQGWQPIVIGNLLLSTLIQSKVGSELHADIHANTYAALKELEHLTKLDYSRVKAMGRASEEFVYYQGARDSIPLVDTRPFFLTFIYDKPKHISLPQSDDAIADTIFMQIFTPIADDMASELDNYEKNLEDLTHLPGEFRQVSLGYSKNFGACGASAMVLPGEDFLAYCIQRFSAEVIRTQITFGLNKNDKSNDDRVRALAKLSIDYSNPKFLKMSDDEREKVINQSFINSVRELARQDAKEKLETGYWLQLVDSLEEGKIIGHDAEGNVKRAESLVAQVTRALEGARERVINKVSIRKKNMRILHRESWSMYNDFVENLKEDGKKAAVVVDEILVGLRLSATEGEMITELKLEPIAERYLVIRLLDVCEKEWIPAAESEEAGGKTNWINNTSGSAVNRLEDTADHLKKASKFKSLFKSKREAEFNIAREQAQNVYDEIVNGTRLYLESKIKLEQFRSLREYLLSRSGQYLSVAVRMDGLVNELEKDAEDMRLGNTGTMLLPVLRIEVLQTLDEPKTRIWDEAYQHLFINEGRYLNTFDRKQLSAQVSEVLKPRIRADGAVVAKRVEEIEHDLKDALYALGEKQMGGKVLGHGNDEVGLTVQSGLDLEARLVLSKKKEVSTHDISMADIQNYQRQKLVALAQLADLLSKVDVDVSAALDDGVVVNRARLVVTGGRDENAPASQEFDALLKNELVPLHGDGRPQLKTWHDPRMIIVHDIATPIPLYYFSSVIGDIEAGYMEKVSDTARSYDLHIDFNWEKSLPNLNPLSKEDGVGWSFELFAKGLLAGIITYDAKNGGWLLTYGEESGDVEKMGSSLASATFHVEKIYQRKRFKTRLDNMIIERLNTMPNKKRAERAQKYIDIFDGISSRLDVGDMKGEVTRDEFLDEPIMRSLVEVLEEMKDPNKIIDNVVTSSGYSEISNVGNNK